MGRLEEIRERDEKKTAYMVFEDRRYLLAKLDEAVKLLVAGRNWQECLSMCDHPTCHCGLAIHMQEEAAFLRSLEQEGGEG